MEVRVREQERHKASQDERRGTKKDACMEYGGTNYEDLRALMISGSQLTHTRAGQLARPGQHAQRIERLAEQLVD